MRALVAGAGKGIGRAVAERLARDCEALVLMDVDAEALAAAARDLAGRTRVETVAGSVAASADCRRAAQAAEALGGLDILSHNAGIQRYGTVETTSEALWDEVIAVNLTGAFLISKACMPLLRASRGAIVHMASVQGLASQAGVVAYAAAKHGLVGLVHAMAVDARAAWRARQRRRAGLGRHADAARLRSRFADARRGLGDDQRDAPAGALGDGGGNRRGRRFPRLARGVLRHRRGDARRRRIAGADRRLAEVGVTGRARFHRSSPRSHRVNIKTRPQRHSLWRLHFRKDHARVTRAPMFTNYWAASVNPLS